MKPLMKKLLEYSPMVLGLLILSAAMVIGCGGGTDDRASDQHAEDDHQEEGGEGEHDEHAAVKLDRQKMVELGVEVKTAGPGELVLHLELSGEVRLNEDRVAHIVPRTPGIVREVTRTVGDLVKEGEALAMLESAELGNAKVAFLASRQQLELADTDLTRMEKINRNTTAMLELLDTTPTFEELRKFEGAEMGENRKMLVSAYSELVLSKSTWDREKRLFDRKISSESDYLAAETGLKKAEAEYVATRDSIHFALRRDLLAARRDKQLAEFEVQSADRYLHVLGMNSDDLDAIAMGTSGHAKLAWYGLRAPFAGRVVEKHITLGEMLETSETAFTVADLSEVWVDLTIYQKDLSLVAPGQTVHVRSGPDDEIRSTITFLSPLVDEATRAATARVVLANKDRAWRPGMFVTASLEYERVSAAIVVTKAAIQTISGESVVFVETKEGFELREVEIGRRNNTNLEIKSGLRAGDRYVSKGAFVLKAETQKSSFGKGHGH